MKDIEITYRDRILLLCLFIFGMIGAIASFLAFAVFYSGIALLSAILCCLLVWIISLIYKSEEFQRLVIEEAKERGGYKIKDWKENWKWFFVVLAVGVLCFWVLPLLEDYILGYNMMIDRGWVDPALPFIVGFGWIGLQGLWADGIYCSGKEMKAARLLCRAKYEGMPSFRDCMGKQIENCKHITGSTGSAYGGRSGSEHTTLIYEPDWRARARLQAYVEVNYKSWLEKYIESPDEDDKRWERWKRHEEFPEEYSTIFFLCLFIVLLLVLLWLFTSIISSL